MLHIVALAQLPLRCCTIGCTIVAVRDIREAVTSFELLVLWRLHLGSLLHTRVAQSLKSQMAPLVWCPTVESDSHVTNWRA